MFLKEMITKLQCEVMTISREWLVGSDRPKTKNFFRKIIYFILREGLVMTIRKALSKMNAKNKISTSTYACITHDEKYAISYDGGSSYYVSSNKINSLQWVNPFAYDELDQASLKNRGSILHPMKMKNSVFLIGCGDYSKTYSIKNFRKEKLLVAVDYNDALLEMLGGEFSYTFNADSQAMELYRKADWPVLLICSYHSDHVRQALDFYLCNKNSYIFIEKPPCVTKNDLNNLIHLYQENASIEIGFNRRYIPLFCEIKNLLEVGAPKFINITVNEVNILENHWYHWENQGTRITGNACHWIDLCQYLIDSRPISLVVESSNKNSDDCVIVICYENGSIANMMLSDKGNDLRGVQERIEIKESNKTIFIDDFICTEFTYKNGSRKKKKSFKRIKGHQLMYKEFIKNINSSNFSTKYPLEDLIYVAGVTMQASEMLLNGCVYKKIEWDDYNEYL